MISDGDVIRRVAERYKAPEKHIHIDAHLYYRGAMKNAWHNYYVVEIKDSKGAMIVIVVTVERDDAGDLDVTMNRLT